MTNILKEIIKFLPDGAISESAFEGANIVLYTKDKDYFKDNQGTIRGAVKEFKKLCFLIETDFTCILTLRTR